jgi:DNA-binding transcriptional ArsR family regulator
MTTASARLHILRAARLTARRRKGKSVIYSITDDHVLMLVENTVALAAEKE